MKRGLFRLSKFPLNKGGSANAKGVVSSNTINYFTKQPPSRTTPFGKGELLLYFMLFSTNKKKAADYKECYSLQPAALEKVVI